MSQKFNTTLVHAGEFSKEFAGAVVMPIFCTANYLSNNESSYDEVCYLRLNNTPNHQALAQKLAAIEGAEAATVTASGMAAISTALLSQLSAGDHLLAQSCLYGGTYSFMHEDLRRFGIGLSLVSGADPSSWEAALTSKTKVFYVEAISNPLLEIADLEAVVAFCKKHKLVSMIDATFATPYNLKPVELGFDLVLHSATKYLNGHSDIVAGVIAGQKDMVGAAIHLLNHLGGTLDPHACVLLQRGLKTLGLRMERHNKNAQALAEFLNDRPEVARVYYPGLLKGHQEKQARKLFLGFGGVLSFELKGGVEAAQRCISKLSLSVSAASLGGVESLVTRPATTSHSGLSAAERLAAGISDGLIRVALGIEDSQDIIEDFKQALAD